MAGIHWFIHGNMGVNFFRGCVGWRSRVGGSRQSALADTFFPRIFSPVYDLRVLFNYTSVVRCRSDNVSNVRRNYVGVVSL